MNFYAVLFVLAIIAFFAWGTFGGMVAAWKDHQSGWFTAIIITWLLGLGWLVGFVYMIKRASSAPSTPRVSSQTPSSRGEMTNPGSSRDDDRSNLPLVSRADEIVEYARGSALSANHVQAAMKVSSSVVRVKAWCFVNDPECILVAVAANDVRRFYGFADPSDVKQARDDFFRADATGKIDMVRLGWAEHVGLHPEPEVARLVEFLELHAESPPPVSTATPHPAVPNATPDSSAESKPPNPVGQGTSAPADSVRDRLQRLKELAEDGLISEAERSAKSEEILRDL